MIELDPVDSLALTLHHTPGVQAILLGSGISRSAGIPTGWEITLDLVRRLAAVQDVVDEPDWAAWYRGRYGEEPGYSALLDAVAATPAERRGILHAYIEGAEGTGRREPTAAHRAVARLASLGAIRVILTTNFDRLLEAALREAGVEPTVIASEDALSDATPLVHSRCTVVKLHGDYMDARIRNTADELDRYPAKIDSLLDRILDEYGLVVAGWSGDWDTALRSAILRAPSRRYPFAWASRGAPTALAADLIAHRSGREIRIADADTFLTQLVGKVEALRSADRPHPTSVALTVAEGTRLCRNELLAPEWSDLLARELTRYRDLAADMPLGMPTKQSVNAGVRHVIARSEALRRLVLTGVRWGGDEAFRTTLGAISALANSDATQSGYTAHLALERLAGAMCFHWAVAAALLREDAARLARIMHLPVRTSRDTPAAAVSALALASLSGMEWKALDGYENHYTPHSAYFAAVFQADALDITLSAGQADEAWDAAEFWIAAETGALRLPSTKDGSRRFWVPPGRFVWSEGGTTLAERVERIQGLQADSPELRAGLLGGNVGSARESSAALKDFLDRVANSWG